MRKHLNKTNSLRAILLLTIGSLAVWLALSWRESKLPEPAPQKVQEAGQKYIIKAVRQIRATEYGGTARVQLLADRIDELLKRNLIVFTGDISHAGYTWRTPTGKFRMFIKVVITENGEFEHQPYHMIADTVFHEAVHTLKRGGVSVEEECDAYEVGLTVNAIALGGRVPRVLHIESKSIYEYVRLTYPGLQRHQKYQPIELPMDVLKKRARIPD